MTSSQHNTEFLMGLLLEENKHLNPIDFIDRQDKASNFCCLCVAMAALEKENEFRNSFMNYESFISSYFELYVSALENYRSIVGNSIRQISVDESAVFYPQKIITHTTTNLVSNPENKKNTIELLDVIKKNHSSMVILRDEIAFVVIHYADDNYIVIDPHVECCGILSKNGIYRYVVYDSVWDFAVHAFIPEQLNQDNVINQSVEDSVNQPNQDSSIDQLNQDSSSNQSVEDSVNQPNQDSSIDQLNQDSSIDQLNQDSSNNQSNQDSSNNQSNQDETIIQSVEDNTVN